MRPILQEIARWLDKPSTQAYAAGGACFVAQLAGKGDPYFYGAIGLIFTTAVGLTHVGRSFGKVAPIVPAPGPPDEPKAGA